MRLGESSSQQPRVSKAVEQRGRLRELGMDSILASREGFSTRHRHASHRSSARAATDQVDVHLDVVSGHVR